MPLVHSAIARSRFALPAEIWSAEKRLPSFPKTLLRKDLEICMRLKESNVKSRRGAATPVVIIAYF